MLSRCVHTFTAYVRVTLGRGAVLKSTHTIIPCIVSFLVYYLPAYNMKYYTNNTVECQRKTASFATKHNHTYDTNDTHTHTTPPCVHANIVLCQQQTDYELKYCLTTHPPRWPKTAVTPNGQPYAQLTWNVHTNNNSVTWSGVSCLCAPNERASNPLRNRKRFGRKYTTNHACWVYNRNKQTLLRFVSETNNIL